MKFQITPEGVLLNGQSVPATLVKFEMAGPGIGQVDVQLEIIDPELTETDVTIEDARVFLLVAAIPGRPRRKFRVLEVLEDGEDNPKRDVGGGVGSVAGGAPEPVGPEAAQPQPQVPPP
jgi:hypothetical protein